MHHIVEESAGLAWRRAVARVLAEGQRVEDPPNVLTELLDVRIDVARPLEEDDIVRRFGDPEMLRWMHANFHDTTPIEGWGYSYGSRLESFGGVNQLEAMVDKLSRFPESKSATMGFLNPPGDRQHVPCVIALDLKLRGGALRGYAFMRSQDAGKKLYADVIAMGGLMKRVADRLGVPVGPLATQIISLHVYGQDIARLEPLLASQAQ